MATVFERVQKIIVEQLGVEEGDVTPQTSFVDDLNADSLDLVELIMAMEEEFSQGGKSMEISDEDAEKIASVQDAVSIDVFVRTGSGGHVLEPCACQRIVEPEALEVGIRQDAGLDGHAIDAITLRVGNLHCKFNSVLR